MSDMRQYIGARARDDAEVRVDEHAILRYAEAVAEPFVERTADGRLIAPLMFLPPVSFGGHVTEDGRRHWPGEPDIVPFTAEHRVMGECVIEYVEPIIAGETIRVTTIIDDIFDKQGSTGPMLFLTYNTVYSAVGGNDKRSERWTLICPGHSLDG